MFFLLRKKNKKKLLRKTHLLFIAKEKLKNIIKKNTFSGNISNKNTDKIKIELRFDCGSI